MLPGFRFLFSAVVLTFSVLVFGLGAAALLRAAHEEFANHPARRAPPEQVFARQYENPTLALLRVDPPVTTRPDDTVPFLPRMISHGQASDEPAAEATTDEPETTAALKADETPVAEATKADTPATATETTEASSEATPPVATTEVKLAALAEPVAPPAATSPQAATVAEPAPVLSLEGNIAATKIATLGGPAVIIEEKTAAPTTDARPDRSVIKKRASQRAREKRRIARRARLAREAALAAQQQQQQQVNPFGEQAPVARRTR